VKKKCVDFWYFKRTECGSIAECNIWATFLRGGNFTNAKDLANRATKSVVILLGDDGKYWVVSLGLGEELAKSGYELAE
jgi:hypothetical protein